jgi:HK97 family phage major capsid protein
MADTDEGQKPGTDPTMTHPQCINRLKDIERALSEITEVDEPSAEDQKYFDELTEEFRTVNAYRIKLERRAQLAKVQSVSENLSAARHLKVERGMKQALGGYGQGSMDDYDVDSILEPDSVEEKRFRNPWDLSQMRTFDRPQQEMTREYRARALSAVETMAGATDRIRAAATDIIERWGDEDGKLDRLILGLSDPAYLRAWSKMARDPRAADLDEAERRSVTRVGQIARAMSLTDAAGGYLVPFQLDPTVIITANGSVNQIRRYAREVVAIGDTWNGVSAGAVSWSYDAEAAQVSDDSPSFAQPTIPIYKAQGFVPISIEAFQDAANVTQEVGRLLAFGKDVLEANAFAVGTGTGMPTGIVTALTGTASEIAAATADTFAIADVYALQASLPARYRNMPSTAWMANNLIYSRVRQFDTAGGAGLWATIGQDRPDTLLGKPVIESEDMDGVLNATQNNYIAIFGDFDNYVIADRIGMTVEFIPHLFSPTNLRPTNQRGWLAYVRHGADSVNDAAFRMLNS